jgi:hypothetical protein
MYSVLKIFVCSFGHCIVCSSLGFDFRLPLCILKLFLSVHDFCLLFPLMLLVRIPLRARCTTLCDKVCQRLAAESGIKHHKTIYYFHLGTVKGKRLLDMGCGPTIHNVMPAAKWFDEIILSDYTPANLEALKKWLNKDKNAADWTQFFKYFSKLDGNE